VRPKGTTYAALHARLEDLDQSRILLSDRIKHNEYRDAEELLYNLETLARINDSIHAVSQMLRYFIRGEGNE